MDQNVKLHPMFNEYNLSAENKGSEDDKQHEAGYDAMMTGVVWFKAQSLLKQPLSNKFPGVEAIMGDNFSDVTDKNKLPMASLMASMDLAGDARSGDADEKPFLFVVENISTEIETDDV